MFFFLHIKLCQINLHSVCSSICIGLRFIFKTFVLRRRLTHKFVTTIPLPRVPTSCLLFFPIRLDYFSSLISPWNHARVRVSIKRKLALQQSIASERHHRDIRGRRREGGREDICYLSRVLLPEEEEYARAVRRQPVSRPSIIV